MPVAVPRYTLADLTSFPDDGNRYELVDGIVLVSPGPGSPHQLAASRLAGQLHIYFGPTPKAIVLTPGTVEAEPDLHLEPDILVVPAIEPLGSSWLHVRTWWLAVEVSGRGSRIYDREYKRPAYLRAGVREVWRADLKERCIFTARPDAPQEARHEERLVWHPPEMRQPLVVDVRAVLEGIRGDD